MQRGIPLKIIIPLLTKYSNCYYLIDFISQFIRHRFNLWRFHCRVKRTSGHLFWRSSIGKISFTILRLFRKEPKFPWFSSTISQKSTAHRVSPPGCPGGTEAAFSPKINTFPDRRKEVIPWRYFALRKPAITR